MQPTIQQLIAQQLAVAEVLLLNHADGHSHEDNIGLARKRFEIAVKVAEGQRNSKAKAAGA